MSCSICRTLIWPTSSQLYRRAGDGVLTHSDAVRGWSRQYLRVPLTGGVAELNKVIGREDAETRGYLRILVLKNLKVSRLP